MTVPRTVIGGKDTSASAMAKMPANANQGASCLVDDLLSNHVYDSQQEKWLPEGYIPFCYDVEEHGGTVGEHSLGITVPANTIILDGMIDVAIGLASSGAGTLALKVEAAGDVLATSNMATIGGLGLHAVVPDGTAAKVIKATADRLIKAVVATAPLTKGKLYGYLRCVRGFAAEETPTTAAPTTVAPTTVAPTTAAPTTAAPTTEAPTTAAPTTPHG